MNPKTADGQEQEPGVPKRGWDRIKELIKADQKKLGGLHPGAMFRLGLAELREAFSWPGGNIAQPTPYGMAGTLTPGEVYSARKNDDDTQSLEEGPQMAQNRLPSPAEIVASQDRGGRGQEQERAQGQEQGSVHGQRDMNVSPSQIAANPEPRAPEQQHSQEHEHGMER